MDKQDFRALADAWGADVERWPEQVRAEAARFALTTVGRQILRDAAEIDAFLAPQLQPAVAPARVGRAIRAVHRRLADERQRKGWLAFPVWRFAIPSAALAAAGVLGVVLALTMTPGVSGPGVGELLAVALSYSDPGFLIVKGG
jgi:hypothetical protein